MRIAYTRSGRGPVLVEVATWLNHLEFDWSSPVWGPRLVELARHFTLVRYDCRGCGLSQRSVDDFTFEHTLLDLEAVVDAAGLEQFILLGCCQGSGQAIAYAAHHPERISQLVLYGSFARGRLKRNPSPKEVETTETLRTLLALGWGQDHPEFRQVYASIFVPDSTPEQARWFTDLQRLSTSPENAVRLIGGFDQMDVSDLLARIRSPTLVIHSRNDLRVPLTEGHLIASSIPGAVFVTLESSNHILLKHQPAWREFFTELLRFVRRSGRDGATVFGELTEREREVLDLIARGLDNAEIAVRLSLSTKTVRNHINSIFGKLDVSSRAQAIVRARETGFGNP